MNIPVASPANFQSYLNKQRKDKFVMVFDIPKVLKEIKSTTQRANSKVIPDSMQFSVYGNVIPEISIPEKEVPYGGQVMKVTGFARPSLPKNTINFTVDNMFNNYWVIYKWLQIFNDEKTGVYNSKVFNDSGLLENYRTTIVVYGLDEYNNRVIEFKYYHCFPVFLGGINYSDRESGELESTFEFVYGQFETNLL